MNKTLLNFLKLYQNENLMNPEIRQRCFSEFMFSIKVKSYMAKLIYFYSYDVEKRIKKISNYERLVDKEFLSHFSSSDKFIEDDINSLLDCKNWPNIVEDLSIQSKKILKLKYIYNLSNKEISKILNTTPQNVSNIHTRMINKLRKNLKGCNI